jgi:predicted MFS family arabinose efflux permease
VKLPLGGPLWAQRDFLRFWFGQTVSVAGSQVTSLALPTVAILTLHAGAVQVGVLRALQSLSWLLLSLVFGVWLDRVRRRRVLLATDLGQALVLISVPLAFLFHVLTLGQLFVVALLTGIFTVAFDIGYETYIPMLVERPNLVEAFSKLQVSRSGARVAGPAIGGFLIQVIGPALAIVADVGSFLVSAAALVTIGKGEARPAGAAAAGLGQLAREIGEGWRAMLRSPTISSLSACSATANLGAAILNSVFLLFAYHELHLAPAQVGVILGVGAIAGVVSALGAASVIRTIGLGRALVLVVIIEGLAILALPAARFGGAIFVVAGMYLMINLMEPIWSIGVGSLRQAVIPDHLRGRITGTSRTIVSGIMPIGAVIGGILGSTIGLAPSILVAGALWILSSTWLALGPVIRLQDQPTGLDPALEGL